MKNGIVFQCDRRGWGKALGMIKGLPLFYFIFSKKKVRTNVNAFFKFKNNFQLNKIDFMEAYLPKGLLKVRKT